jgi:RimJ/RimL family protein N-acetyltransferase
MPWLEPFTLIGSSARLEPLTREHAASATEAARDGELWNLWYTSVPRPEAMAAEIDRRLSLQEKGSMLPFAVFDIRVKSAPKLVGMTTYMSVDAVHRRVEIGYTWYAKSVQRTAINTECKRLLLQHAFETLDCIAVEFRTHRLNTQSRRAIERLGAQLDGILRAHQRSPDGSIRDTAVYSITAPEWTAIKAHLTWQLTRDR